jgi:hypothetical protein
LSQSKKCPEINQTRLLTVDDAVTSLRQKFKDAPWFVDVGVQTCGCLQQLLVYTNKVMRLSDLRMKQWHGYYLKLQKLEKSKVWRGPVGKLITRPRPRYSNVVEDEDHSD